MGTIALALAARMSGDLQDSALPWAPIVSDDRGETPGVRPRRGRRVPAVHRLIGLDQPGVAHVSR